jgi:hypothetical protein
MILKALVLLVIACSSSLLAHGQEDVWARGAVHFGNECADGGQVCRLASVRSPDGNSIVEVRLSGDALVLRFSKGSAHFTTTFRLTDALGHSEIDLLWSLDSSAFSLTWSKNAYTESTQIFVVGGDGLVATDMSALHHAFALRYPPCAGKRAASYISRTGRDYNYVTVAAKAPHTFVMMAEVPPSSSYGAHMGKVLGYEVDAATGKILDVMRPREFKRRWQSHIGWKFELEGTE